MKRPSLLSFGEVLWDVFPEGPRFGGAPANFACHAAMLGANVSLVSAVGGDERGREAKRILQGYGIDTSLVQVTDRAPTGTVGVDLDESGKPRFTIHGPAAWDFIEWSGAMEHRLEEVHAVYFGTLGQRSAVSRVTIRRMLSMAAGLGLRRILDVNLRQPHFDASLIRESVALANILKLSDDEAGIVCDACGVAETDDMAGRLQALRESGGLDILVVTRGAEGALVVTADEVVDQCGYDTEVVDTVGAGDSFTAAFVTTLLTGDAIHHMVPPREVLASAAMRACRLASYVCARAGAVPPHGDMGLG